MGSSYFSQGGSRSQFGLSAESIRRCLFSIGQMADSPMGQARKEFKAARARLGSTHSHWCIVSVRGSAVCPLGSRVRRLCHLAKRAASWQWPTFTGPKWRVTDEQVWKSQGSSSASGLHAVVLGASCWPAVRHAVALPPGEEGQGFFRMVETFRPGLTNSGRDEKFPTILIKLCSPASRPSCDERP